MARLLSKSACTVAFLVYWATCFTLTHVPLQLKTAPRLLKMPHADKVVHFGLYFSLAIFLAYVLRLWYGKVGDRSRWFVIPIVTILFCGLCGIFDEVTQAWVPTRSADPLDWLCDLAGAVSGLLILLAIKLWNGRWE